MKSIAMHAQLALASLLLCLGSRVSADEPAFIDVGRRFELLQRATAARPLVQPASFESNGHAEGGFLPAPRDLTDPAEGESGDECDSSDPACCDGDSEPIHGVYFAEVQLMWLRSHVMESAVGKLSEKYEISPRFVVGYENAGGVGGRIRYWHYGRVTPNLTNPADALRLEFDVLDLEGTARFGNDRSELVVAGGMRWADARIELGGESVANDMPGITFAADLRTIICRQRCWEWASLAGARWSILGGDWEGSNSGFIMPTRDDNLTVTEIYGGVEYVKHYRGFDAYARLVFEVQTWHSDAASQSAGAESINFIGPGLHLGMNF
jgi:hypothetical protein